MARAMERRKCPTRTADNALGGEVGGAIACDLVRRNMAKNSSTRGNEVDQPFFRV